ncbi:MAG: hypothetical protein ACXV5H_07120 [Halobacteriota archaeon]
MQVQRRHIIIAIVVIVMLASVWVAGCFSNRETPKPSSTSHKTPTNDPYKPYEQQRQLEQDEQRWNVQYGTI